MSNIHVEAKKSYRYQIVFGIVHSEFREWSDDRSRVALPIDGKVQTFSLCKYYMVKVYFLLNIYHINISTSIPAFLLKYHFVTFNFHNVHTKSSLGSIALEHASPTHKQFISTNRRLSPRPNHRKPILLRIYKPHTYIPRKRHPRRILHLTPLGTLSTIFPNSSSSLENRPSNLENIPIGLMDYIADCEPTTNNPTILAISIATSFKNAISNPNISLSLSWTPPYPPKSRISYSEKPDPFAFSAANQPRFSILGYLEHIATSPEEEQDLRKCFVDTHPDAKYWLPGNHIHHSEWMRLVVQEIYWVGGFGDRAYIGWIPIEEWRSVDRKEWEEARLVGEKKGWKEWAVEGLGFGGAWEL